MAYGSGELPLLAAAKGEVGRASKGEEREGKGKGKGGEGEDDMGGSWSVVARWWQHADCGDQK